MIDLRTYARGLVFDCLGLAECAAESCGARCPCARRCIAPARVSEPSDAPRETPVRTANPPAPTLGDVLIEAARRRGNG